MNLPIAIEIRHPDLLVGIVEASDVPGGPAAPALAAAIDAALARQSAAGTASPAKAAVRDLLRFGGYKPAGRGKPASEYLAEAARRNEFPRISHIVDALNLVSLESGLPISLLDAERALDGAAGAVIRLGRPGERYVFNSAGHDIDVAGLLVAARANGDAIANPVKDSMAAKTTAETRRVLAIVWASRRIVDADALRAICEGLGQWLAGTGTTVRVLS